MTSLNSSGLGDCVCAGGGGEGGERKLIGRRKKHSSHCWEECNLTGDKTWPHGHPDIMTRVNSSLEYKLLKK